MEGLARSPDVNRAGRALKHSRSCIWTSYSYFRLGLLQPALRPLSLYCVRLSGFAPASRVLDLNRPNCELLAGSERWRSDATAAARAKLALEPTCNSAPRFGVGPASWLRSQARICDLHLTGDATTVRWPPKDGRPALALPNTGAGFTCKPAAAWPTHSHCIRLGRLNPCADRRRTGSPHIPRQYIRCFDE